MKVLYVAPFLDQTGYAEAAGHYALALDSIAGLEVACRPIKLNGAQGAVGDRLAVLMDRSSAGCDVVVQHALPSMMEPDGRFRRNVGLFAWETTHFRRSGWTARLNAMDEAWVVSRQQAEACRESGVTVPVRVMPHACDVDEHQAPREPLPGLPGGFKFYAIGEMVRRKNWTALLLAFHAEFGASEPVSLVVKVSRPGLSPDAAADEFRETSRRIKASLGLRGHYKDEHVVAERVSREEMLRLHASCDCYVCPSHGEAWNLGAFDAMAMGKTPIVTGWGGPVDYLSDAEGWLVDHRLGPCSGGDAGPGLYTAAEDWAEVDVNHLRACMRRAYEERDERAKGVAGAAKARRFSHEAVGGMLAAALMENGHAKGAQVVRSQGPRRPPGAPLDQGA